MQSPSPSSDLTPNAVFYQILKPGPLRDAQGNAQYAIASMAADLAQASALSSRIPGSAIVMCCVLFVNNIATLSQTPAPANK